MIPLSDTEKKLLSVLHESRFVNGKMIEPYNSLIHKHIKFSEKELNDALSKFLKLGFLSELVLTDNDVMYWFTDKTPREFIDRKLHNLDTSDEWFELNKNFKK